MTNIILPYNFGNFHFQLIFFYFVLEVRPPKFYNKKKFTFN